MLMGSMIKKVTLKTNGGFSLVTKTYKYYWTLDEIFDVTVDGTHYRFKEDRAGLNETYKDFHKRTTNFAEYKDLISTPVYYIKMHGMVIDQNEILHQTSGGYDTDWMISNANENYVIA